MPTSVFYLYDLEGSFAQLFLYLDESGSEPASTVSPPPSEMGKDYRRAIARHGVPNLDRDLIQDMGAHSREYPISGISRIDLRDALESRFLAAQITVSNPAGRWRIYHVSSANLTVTNQSGLVMDRYSWRYAGGLRGWFRYNLHFIEAYGQS